MSPHDGSDGAIADRGPFLIGLMWPLTGISLVTVILRLVFRYRGGKFNWSDIFMVFSMLDMFGWSICLTILCVKGGERHVWGVEKLGVDDLAQVQLLNWLSQVFGILWIVTIGLTSAIAVSCSFLTMLQCSPPAALWDPRIQGKCVDSRVMSGFGIFTGDGSLAVLPTTVILSLANSPIKKLQLTIVFGLNILTCICSGIKTQYLAQLANRTDFTWATFDIFAWVTVEFFLMIVCGTIPTLHGLLVAIQSTTEALKSACSCGTRGNSNDNTGDAGLRIEQKDVARCEEQVTIGRMATRKPGWDNAQGGRSSEYLFQDLLERCSGEETGAEARRVVRLLATEKICTIGRGHASAL